jgi:beta-mannosidase
MRVSALLLLLLPVARAAGLVDDPILGDGNAAQYLDGEAWTATGSLTPSSDPVTVGALVPGDLLTDLQRAGLIADPLYELTFQGTEWDSSPWSYSTTFDVDPHILVVLQSSGGSAALVFDSVKMGADIYLNGNLLGVARDQFLRYVFPVSLDSPNSTITPANNNLTVLFHVSADASNDEGRWQACSGAWDWAPYGTTFAPGGSHTFSKGLVKSVYLVPLPGPGALVTHIVPRVTYTGPYPTSPLADGAADPFNVTVDVVLVARQAGTGTLTVTGGWAPASPVVVPVSWSSAAAETVVSVALPQAVAVQLWWPRGLGGQALYPVTVTLAPSAPGTSPATGSRRVGFRSLALVTSDDSDPAALEGINGSGNFTMRFKVNGADWYARGANMIPLEELEGRQTAAAYVASLSSAAAASHSLLRIWGGGLFLPNAFYDTCDELGVALYHDLMYGTAWFGGNSSRPSNTTTQLAEITHQVRRLSPHPSILLWNGGNEDLGRWDATVTGFLMPTVAAVDATRPVWPASPSSGWASGVDRLWGLPNGQPFVLPTGPDAGFETHGPYQHGAGFQTVNGQGALDLFPANMPPALASSTATAYGPHVRGVFASEFGCSAFSSFESMAPTLAPEHWSAMSPPMVQRNYPTNNIISVYFGNATAERWLNATGVEAFRASTYLATLGSALQQKSDIEARRSGNAWGTVTWQLGEM